MPVRPPAYCWEFSEPFEPIKFDNAVSLLARQLGWSVEFRQEEDTEVRLAVLRASPEQLKASAEQLDAVASLEELDPPEGDEYALVVSLASPDDLWASHRLVVDPETNDNWAAWGFAGVVGERVARALGGHEITGNPPPWVDEEARRPEPPFPEHLPALALRGRIPFPGFVTALSFGRPASVTAIRQMLASKAVTFVSLLQRDPGNERPIALHDFHGIGVASRIVRTVEQESGLLLVIKGIARVRIESLSVLNGGLSTKIAVCAEDHPALTVDDLRSFAQADPLIESSAGCAAMAEVRNLPAGKLCDFITVHGDNGEAVAPVLTALATAERVRLVRQHFGALLNPST
jgi:hypothetical protein